MIERCFPEHATARDGTTLAGVIDFEEAHFADPAIDFVALRGELGCGFSDRMLEAYAGDIDGALRERGFPP